MPADVIEISEKQPTEPAMQALPIYIGVCGLGHYVASHDEDEVREHMASLPGLQRRLFRVNAWVPMLHDEAEELR
jgi:hypothetical protein